VIANRQKKHFSCKPLKNSVATRQESQMITTQQRSQLQLDKQFDYNSSEHFNYNSINTPVATQQSLQLQLLE
jgi:hypothetical protein